MKRCVFLGPTLPVGRVPETIDVFGPAALGSIYRAVEDGYTRIGIVDGVFGAVPSVWHKEILYAIGRGAAVYGASSLGALRAAELYPYGMEGAGWIYRMFRAGVLTDDDEVAVVHGPMNVAYAPLSEPMVNIRFTLNRMRKAGLLSREEAARASRHCKDIFYAERTLDGLRDYLCAQGLAGDPEAALRQHYFDVKADDTVKLLERMCSDPAQEAPERLWQFRPTKFWSIQFGRSIADVPPLEPRRRGGGPAASSGR